MASRLLRSIGGYWNPLRFWLRVTTLYSVTSVCIVYFLVVSSHGPHLLPYTFNCETECYIKLWLKPPSDESSAIVSHIRQHMIDPLQHLVPDPPRHNEFVNPSWKELGSWDLVQDVIRYIFVARYNGIFVEVGAGDGIFMSHTSWLENERGWRGLLLEPRLLPYENIRRRRKAASARVCVSDEVYSKKEEFWSPLTKEEMPEIYSKGAAAMSTLLKYVAKEDHEAGTVSNVQCFTLNALLAAGIGRNVPIDLMVVHTGGGEADIITTLHDVTIMMLVARYHTKLDKMELIDNADRLNMFVYNNTHPALDNNFLFFINKEVKFFEGDPNKVEKIKGR